MLAGRRFKNAKRLKEKNFKGVPARHDIEAGIISPEKAKAMIFDLPDNTGH